MGWTAPPVGVRCAVPLPDSPAIEKGRGFAYACPRPEEIVLSNSGGRVMDESQGQGPAWIVFLVWLLVPLLIFFMVITFTG